MKRVCKEEAKEIRAQEQKIKTRGIEVNEAQAERDEVLQ